MTAATALSATPARSSRPPTAAGLSCSQHMVAFSDCVEVTNPGCRASELAGTKYRRTQGLLWSVPLAAVIASLGFAISSMGLWILLGILYLLWLANSAAIASNWLEIRPEKLVFHGWGSLTVRRDRVASCRYHALVPDGRSVTIAAFVISESPTVAALAAHSIVISSRGWPRARRRALFSQLQEWLAGSSAVIDHDTQRRLDHLAGTPGASPA